MAAFTKVPLDALGKDTDEDNDGLISMSELTHYLATHVSGLTGGNQHPGIEQRFEGEVRPVITERPGLGAALNFRNWRIQLKRTQESYQRAPSRHDNAHETPRLSEPVGKKGVQ
jgi:hypothetical protein